MIAGIFHKGSGLGNQLHRYVATRVLAFENEWDFGMIYPENFKGKDFMKIEMGSPVKGLLHEFNEKKVVNKEGHDVRPFDPTLRKVQNFTLIDGEFQDERYFRERLANVRGWLKVEPLTTDDNLCVINFRGGEYVGVHDLFLPQGYWDKAIEIMKLKYKSIRFEVHTDDIHTARKFFPFPSYKIIHDIGLNWRSVRYAKHLILSNSSFAILPALLGEAAEIIAPNFWAGRNKGYWQLPQNQYQKFTYI